MSVEQCRSLRAWGTIVGVDGDTLKRWLEADLHLTFPPVSRGSKHLVRERDIEIVVKKHMPQWDPQKASLADRVRRRRKVA